MSDLQHVTLDRLGGGAALELWAKEFERVLDNIMDPNTEPEKKRTIALKVTIAPNEARDVAAVAIECSSSVAPNKPHGTVVYIGREQRGGALVALERDQRSVFDDEEPAGVLPLDRREGTDER